MHDEIIDPRWANTIAQNLEGAEIAIVACAVAIIFFMKYNQREGRNEANKYIGICLGVGFLALIAFRIFKGVIKT